MNIIEINTTAYNEENFYVATDINTEELSYMLPIIINKLRKDTDNEYINEDIITEVNNKYPYNTFNQIEIEYLSI